MKSQLKDHVVRLRTMGGTLVIDLMPITSARYGLVRIRTIMNVIPVWARIGWE